VKPVFAISALWISWALSWTIAAWWSGRTENRPSIRSEAPYRILMGSGAALMFVPAHGYEGSLRLWHIGWTGAWVCVALVAWGIALAWWARLYLGRLWSAGITRKAEHHLVDSGPYALVRHPIYTGLLLSLLATAAAKGTWLGGCGFVLLLWGLWLKARMEEHWLIQELGVESYADYRRRVPMLIPFGPTQL
jgi:protein-S-isoprenylcysteine O-methyltransferase Ste14